MRGLVVVAALVVATTATALALPGQSLKAVCTWAKASNDLRGVNCASGAGATTYILGYIRRPDVAIPGRAPNDNVLSFEAHPDGHGTIATEIIHYHHLPDIPSIAFGRRGEGFDIIRGLYGNAIANDFAAAHRVKHTTSSDVYRGKRFLYISTSIRQSVIGADPAHAVVIDDGFIVRAVSSSASDLGY